MPGQSPGKRQVPCVDSFLIGRWQALLAKERQYVCYCIQELPGVLLALLFPDNADQFLVIRGFAQQGPAGLDERIDLVIRQ